MKFLRKNIFWVIAVVLFLAAAGALGWDYYTKWQGEKKIEELANELKRLQQEFYDAKAADKIGGATPQETLDMFISAVEAGDYDLASKYFVLENQEKWKKDLKEVGAAGKLNTLLEPLKRAIYSDEGYSLDKKSYNIHDPILVSFVLYPSGNWKLEEI